MRVFNFILAHSLPYRWYLLSIMVATCITTSSDLLIFVLIKKIIESITQSGYADAWKFCFFYGVILFIGEFFWAFNDYCLVYYQPRLTLDITEHFIKQFYTFDYIFFQNNLTGNITAKFNDIFSITTELIFKVTDKFIHFFLLVTVSTFLLYFVKPIFAFIMVAWVVFYFLITFFYLNKALTLIQQYAEKKSDIFASMSDYVSNMLQVKMFSTRDFELSRFQKLKEAFRDASDKQGFFFILFYAFQGVFKDFYMILFVVFLVLKYKQSLISTGDFSLVFMINYNLTTNVYNFFRDLREFVLQWGSLQQALTIFDIIPEIQDKSNATTMEVDKGSIIFDHVDFHYKNIKPLFQNLSVTFEAGKKVGLVGCSGGGKSTCINLILRLYDVTSGDIFIDGQNIREVTQDSLRRNIGIIPQDTTLFHRNVMDNIRYGKNDASDQEVIEAAKKAHAHEFISKLPQGYESPVGERGIKLSGGQRQRIAIARAFLKNAPILILDEATSQMDSLTEQLIQESLLVLSQHKTTIVIAHRLSTLLSMDRILVFDQGAIIEDGSHKQLLEKNGLYKTLWSTQSGGFLLYKD